MKEKKEHKKPKIESNQKEFWRPQGHITHVKWIQKRKQKRFFEIKINLYGPILSNYNTDNLRFLILNKSHAKRALTQNQKIITFKKNINVYYIRLCLELCLDSFWVFSSLKEFSTQPLHTVRSLLSLLFFFVWENDEQIVLHFFPLFSIWYLGFHFIGELWFFFCV